MDDFGNALAPRHDMFGYIWWMYGLETYRSFYVGFEDDLSNDIP